MSPTSNTEIRNAPLAADPLPYGDTDQLAEMLDGIGLVLRDEPVEQWADARLRVATESLRDLLAARLPDTPAEAHSQHLPGPLDRWGPCLARIEDNIAINLRTTADINVWRPRIDETVRILTRRVDAVDSRFGRRLDAVTQRLDTVEQHLGNQHHRLDAIGQKLDTLLARIGKDAHRLTDPTI